jgi:hypothetical protein
MKVFITIAGETTITHYDTQKRTNQISPRGDLDNDGVCRVSYRSNEYNEFKFHGKDDFRNRFKPCVEPDLLRFLGVK